YSSEGTAVADGEAVVTINNQNLDVDFVDDDEDTVNEVRLDEDFNTLVVSNRGEFDLEASSDELSQSDLQELLRTADNSGSEFTTNVTDRDDTVGIEGVSGDFTLENLNFDEANLDSGEYSFNFEAEDTGVTSSANITVGDETDSDANFDDAVITQNRGDIVNVSLTTQQLEDSEEIEIVIGDTEDANYEAAFLVEPNDDGEVIFQVNTFVAGRDINDDGLTYSVDNSFTPSTAGISVSEGSIVGHVNPDGTVQKNGEINVTTDDTEPLTRVIDTGLYDISASQSPEFADDPDELDVSAMEIVPRQTGNVTVHSAPNAKFSELNDEEEFYENFNEGNIVVNDELAIAEEGRTSDRRGDVAVVAIDVSGIYGAALAKSGETEFKDGEALARGLLSNDGIALNLTQENPRQNRAPTRLVLDSTNADGTEAGTPNYLFDNENNTLYLSVRTSDLDQSESRSSGGIVRAGDEYNASLRIEGEFLDDFKVINEGETETTNGTYSMVDREVNFDTVNDRVRVNPKDNQVISGETTVAPGTELRVRARATGDSPFLKANTTTVAQDGSFEAVYTGSDSFEDVAVGTNFTATIPSQSFEDDAETDGRVVEGDVAEVSISDQTTDGTTATVDSVYVPDGGFVTIHDGSLLDGATFDSVRGTSDYLSSGESTGVTVTLDTPYEEDGTLVAMPHKDTNGNQEYDFVTSEGAEDGPYTNAEGDIVLDDAALTVQTATPTPTATATATATETATETATATETTESQPGFGAALALIALIGAALLAARRNDF
ncbi:MAG: PGF-CTERM protein, partial [Natronomonas sp.]|uniref:DUF7282 domain-containing protein n=1 Tax=Natronomonas sp. TaxID=2184060 RepID=UPI003988D211